MRILKTEIAKIMSIIQFQFYITFYYTQLGIYMSTHKIESTFTPIDVRQADFGLLRPF